MSEDWNNLTPLQKDILKRVYLEWPDRPTGFGIVSVENLFDVGEYSREVLLDNLNQLVEKYFLKIPHPDAFILTPEAHNLCKKKFIKLVHRKRRIESDRRLWETHGIKFVFAIILALIVLLFELLTR